MENNLSNFPRILIAGTHSGVGKTTITLGLMAILSEKGYVPQGYKVGPDYIDPSHHMSVTNRPSRNLDTWLMSKDVCIELFERSLSGSNIAVIEGVMGLYDGCLNGTELGSTAHIAKILNTPTILVVDAKGMSRSASAVVLGYRNFDRDVKLKGIILNRVKSERHFSSLKKSIEENCHIQVLGYLPFDEKIALPERHLGLVPSVEQELSKSVYKKIGNLMSSTIDIDEFINIAKSTGSIPFHKNTIFKGINDRFYFRLAVAMDEAFNFYYHDNLDLLESYGVELTYFSPLYDKYLPADIDGLYIGGGFPELFAAQLNSNETMKESIRKAYKNGMVIYGECGGMMYLLEQIVDFRNNSYEMCGLLRGTAKMENKRQGLGYIIIKAAQDNLLCRKDDVFRAHEFHWSSLHVPQDTQYAYTISKCDSSKTQPDGLLAERILASYAHVHFATDSRLILHFLQSIKKA